jgi:hypothetical protein
MNRSLQLIIPQKNSNLLICTSLLDKASRCRYRQLHPSLLTGPPHDLKPVLTPLPHSPLRSLLSKPGH